MLLSFSTLIAIFPNLTSRNWKKFILYFAVSAISVIALDNKFQSLYVDLIFGLLFAVSLVSIGFDEEFPLDRFTVVLFSTAALAVIKPLGILFSLVSMGLLFYKFARVSFLTKRTREILAVNTTTFQTFSLPSNFLIIPILAMLSWSIHISNLISKE